MAETTHRAAFNSPLETGVRALAILSAVHPASFDLERLVEMDYLVVHSGDVGGPESLHAPLPLRAGELLVRRNLIERGLMLMVGRGLVARSPAPEGILYQATEDAAPFLASLATEYALMLKDRATWAAERFGAMTTAEIRQMTSRFFERWSSQFQPLQGTGSVQ